MRSLSHSLYVTSQFPIPNEQSGLQDNRREWLPITKPCNAVRLFRSSSVKTDVSFSGGNIPMPGPVGSFHTFNF